MPRTPWRLTDKLLLAASGQAKKPSKALTPVLRSP
jgi:hypothetical protein